MKSIALIAFINQLGALLQGLSAALDAERLASLPTPTPVPDPTPTPNPDPVPPTPPAPAFVYLSDRNPSQESNGWGPYERDRANGENVAGDGAALTIGGVTFAKGLGVHAPAALTYQLGGSYSRFQAFIGVDDAIPVNEGSVVFIVQADGVEIFRSVTITRGMSAQFIDLDIAGRQALQLIVGTANGSAAWDHANWAEAKLAYLSTAPVPTMPPFYLGSTPVTPAVPGTPTPPPPPENPSGSLLSLPRVPWHGGPAYYQQFATTAATGDWVDPNWFPISVFYGKPEHTASLQAAGINTFLRAENPGDFTTATSMTDLGMYLILQSGWETKAAVRSDPNVVGWMVSEELDMGPNGESGNLAEQVATRNYFAALNDGRFLQSNFGNGVLGTFWAPNTMDDLISTIHATSVDKYAYSSPVVRYEYNRTPAWGLGGDASRASRAYGWQQDRMVSLGSTLNGTPTGVIKPNWVFVESARPFIWEEGSETIGLEEMEGATWNALIHGASGLAWFQHNNDFTAESGNMSVYSIVSAPAPRRNKVIAINDQVMRMAPVLNTQSYVWNFGTGLDTCLKVQGGYAWIIAMPLPLTGNGPAASGSRTFTLPPGIAGTTVTVFDESRTIPVVAGAFTDTFAAEYDHHIYRISLA